MCITDNQDNLQKRIVRQNNLQKNCLKGPLEKSPEGWFAKKIVWKDNLKKKSPEGQKNDVMIYKNCRQNYPQRQFTKSNPIQV